MTEETTLHPAWREALRVLLEEGLEYGRILDKCHLVKLFKLKEPVTARDQREFDIEFFSMLSALRDELLEEHQLDLHTMRGHSKYCVTYPGEQTDLAMREGFADMQRALSKTARRLVHIRHNELSDEQSRHNADALAKAASLAGMVNRPRLPNKGDSNA